MAPERSSGIAGTVPYTLRSILRPGSLPIDRDRLARGGAGIFIFGAFPTCQRGGAQTTNTL
jgi:hypothetical protein